MCIYDDMTNFIGYRNMICEDIIYKCIDAAYNGAPQIIIEHEDLTDVEADYIQKEIRRRLNM